MELFTPKEPAEVKAWILHVERMTDSSPGINWDTLNVWYGNKLPKYLWDQWKDILKPAGFSWQSFLKLLSRRTDAVLMWYKGVYTWEQFIEETKKLVSGPLGQDLLKNKNGTKV